MRRLGLLVGLWFTLWSGNGVAAVPAAGADAACGTVIVPTGLGASYPATLSALNPLFSPSLYAREVIQQVLRPLAWFDADGTLDAERGIARSIDTPDDGGSFVVTLADRRWSDGVPLTADDLLFTIDLVRRLGPGYVYYGTGGMPDLIAGARALDPHRVELRMSRRVNPRWFESVALGNLFYLLPKHVFDGLSPAELRRRQSDPALFAVGDGPFVLREYSIGRHLVLVPNPYWGGRPPQVRRLVVSFPNGDAALEQLRADQLDAASVPYLLSGFSGRLRGFHLVPRGQNTTYGEGYLNFRSEQAPFLRELAVRRAITRAIDQGEIIALAFHGSGAVHHGPVPGSMSGYLSAAARAGYPDLSFDPAAARALLDGAGWRVGSAGSVREKNGRRLAFTITTSAESAPGLLMAQVIQRDLARVGIDVQLHIIGFNQLLATLAGNGHDWDVITLNWTVEDYPDVHDDFAAGGSQNYGHYADPTMDRLTAAERFGSGDAAMLAVQDYAAEQVAMLYLPTGTPPVLVRDGMGGMADFLPVNGLWAAEDITLSGVLSCPVPARAVEAVAADAGAGAGAGSGAGGNDHS